MAAPSTPPRQLIYVSYSRRDRKLVEDMLAVVRELLPDVEIFYDVLIQAGEDFSDTLARRLDEASIVLFCLSPESLASRYCQREMETALGQQAQTKRLVPIVLKPCDWFSTPLATLRALPRDAKPVTAWRVRSEAFDDIARGLQSIVFPAGSAPTPAAPGAAEPLAHTGRVRRIAVSANGRRVVSASSDRTAIVWDLATMQPVASINHDAAVSDVAIDPSSKTVATSAGASIAIWDLDDRSRPSRSIAAGSTVIGAVWLQSGLVALTESSFLFEEGDQRFKGLPYYEAGSTYTTIASSWDRRALVAGKHDGRCQWFQSEGTPLESRAASVPILEIHPLPDGIHYASCSADGVQVFGFDGSLRSFSFSTPLVGMAPMPDGKRAAIATAEGLKLLDLSTGSILNEWPLSDPPTAVATTPDGTMIVWGTASGAVSCRSVDMTIRQPLPVGEDRLRLAYLAVLELPELWAILENLDESALVGLGAQLQLSPDEDMLHALQGRRPGVEPPALWMSWITSLYPSKLGKLQGPR